MSYSMKKIIFLLILFNFTKSILCAQIANFENITTTSLTQAVLNGDIDMIRNLLKSGANIDEVGYFYEFDEFVFKFPLSEEYKSKIEAEFLAWQQRTKKFFCEIDNFYTNQNGKLPESIHSLIESGILIHFKDKKDENNPLMAVLDNYDPDIDIVKQLVALKADVNKENGWKKTPLQAAIQSNRLKCIKILLNAGADINMQGQMGYTPLNSAIRFMEKFTMNVINFLITQKPDFHIGNKYEETPLHWAIHWYISNASLEYINKTKKERLQIIDDLIELGANPYYQGQNEQAKSPLDWANNNAEVIKLVQEKTANKILSAWESFPAPLIRLIAQYTVGVENQN